MNQTSFKQKSGSISCHPTLRVSECIKMTSKMKRHKDMLIKATIAGGGVIPHIHKSLLEKQRAQGESGPAAPAKSN